MTKEKIIYGYTPSLPIFENKSLEQQVNILKELGITGVFGGYKDPEFIKAMHEEGLKVYGSFGCFKGEEVWNEFPEARPMDENGDLLEPDGKYYGVNPAYPLYRDKQLVEIKKLIDEYDIDGLWLDFVRWPCHWEVKNTYLPKTSFDSITINLFEKDCTIKIKDGSTKDKAQDILCNYEEQWIRWRCDKITSWIKEVRDIINGSGKNITLGMFGVPWINGEKENGIIQTIGQDYKAISQYIDIISPMVYHKMCGKPPEWIGEVTNFMMREINSKIVPIIQSVDAPEILSLDEYEKSIAEALNLENSHGIMVFKLEGIVENKERFQVTKNKFLE